MNLLIIDNSLYEFNDTFMDIYDTVTGEMTSSQTAFNTIFNLPVDSVDAVLNWGDGTLYFFKGDSYYKYNTYAGACEEGYPRLIAGNWNGLWTANIWACTRKDDKAYFFGGEEYMRYDCNNNVVDEGYPLNISANWKGIPASISGIAMLDEQYALIQDATNYYIYHWGNDVVVNTVYTPLNAVLNNYHAILQGTGTVTEPEEGTTGGAAEEESLASDAAAIIETLKAKKPGVNLGGDSAGGKKIGNFPAWFGILQDLLTQSTAWSDDEEKGQKLLQQYIVSYYAGKGEAMPPNIAVFIRYIGRGEANKNATERIPGLPHAGQLGAVTQQDQDAGRGKRYQWCQAAASSAVNMGLKENGYAFTTGANYTDKWYKEKPAERIITGTAAFSATLEGGDMFSVVSNKTALSGHVMTAMEDNGDTILAVSGNAGGRAIRIEEIKRGTPPAGFNWSSYYDDTKPKQPGINQPVENGVVWVVSIQRTSLLNQLNITDAAELAKYSLKKL